MIKSKYAIIVAGGEGNRAGGSVPKQFQMLRGVPMLWWSVRAFHAEDAATKIILVIHPGFFDLWDILHKELPAEDQEIQVKVVCGGRSRLESVKNGLMSVEDGEEALVAVQDAARPLITRDLIARGWATAEQSGAGVPVTAMTDSIRRVEGDRSVAVARKDYVKVQTPQTFEASLLKDAYEQELTAEMTDDASVVEAAGHPVAMFDGSPYNMKVTDPLDLKIAELIMESTTR